MKLRALVGVLVLLGTAAALRAGTDVLVVTDAGVHLAVPGDPYYHLRRIVWSTAHFPRVIEVDPYLNHPDGARVVWPPAFDGAIAGAARLLVGADDPAGAERVAARAPAVLGVAAVLAVFLLARRRIAPVAAWVAAGLLAVLPNHVLHSQVGQLDHHVAVSLVAVGLLALAFGLVRARPPGVARGLASGLGFGASLLVWPGMLIHVGLLEALLLAWAASSRARDEACARLRALAALNAGACVAVAPFAWDAAWAEFGAWSPWVLSRFQPVFFAAAAATLVGAAAAWRRFGTTRARRLGLAAGLGAAGLAVAFAGIPGLAASLATAAGWFSKAESFQHQVSELRPFGPGLAISRYTLLVALFPLAWAWLAWRGLRAGGAGAPGSRWLPAERGLLLGLAAAFFVLGALQRRFGNTFSVLYVLVWGAFAAEALAALRARPRARAPAWATAAVVGVASLATLLAFHGPRQETLSRAHADPDVARRGPLPVAHRLYDAAGRWLATASPPTRGWDDPTLEPEYGVLARWDAGHLLRYRARRPMVQDNFGVYGGRANYEAAERYYAARDEAAALAVLEALEVRYVLADRHGAGQGTDYAPDAMARRLAGAWGSATPDAPALAHHRLIWHQRTGRGIALGAEPPGSAVGVWEIVPGARVTGRAAPGAEVEARLALRTEAGRPHAQRAVARAGPDGVWTLVLPYPTDRPWSSAMTGLGPWELASGGRSAPLEVPEAAVQAGASLPGPDLRPAEGAGP